MSGPNRSDYKAWNVAPGIVRVSCVFIPNGSSPPTVESRIGISGVTRTGTGVYRIDLIDKYVALESFCVTLYRGVVFTGDHDAHLAGEDVASAKTVTIRTVSSGTPADMLYLDDPKVCVALYLKATTAV